MVNFSKQSFLLMAFVTLLASILLVSACSRDGVESAFETEAIMDSIEKKLKIPPGGRSLDQYVRYYRYDHAGNVSVVYITSISDVIEEFCNQNPDCTPEAKRIGFAEAGTRMWLKDFDLISGMDDGGCDYIQFEYITKTEEISNLRCNAVH